MQPAAQMGGGALQTPQSMAHRRIDTPDTLNQDDVEREVRALQRQRDWVRNPEYIMEEDMLIMRRMAVNVLKQMVPPAYLHLVRELKTHTFSTY